MIQLGNSKFHITIDDRACTIAATYSGGPAFSASPAVPFASICINNRILDAAAASYTDRKLTILFQEEPPLILTVSEEPECLIFTVENCPACDSVLFAKMAFPGMNLMGMALNSATTGAAWVTDPNETGMAVVSTKAPSGAQLISAQGIAGAQAYRKPGILGASYAVLASADHEELRLLAKAVVSKYTVNIPYSHKGGAFADDEENHDLHFSYLLNLSGISEAEVDEWILLAHSFGAKQIDFHGGETFRFGDYQFNPDKYPDGIASMKRVIARLHKAGIQAGLHTYAQFISPYSEYVTPIPHPDLAGTYYTLAHDLDLSSAAALVLESTEGVSSITGFFVQNSAHLVVDNEIIRFDETGAHEFRITARGEFGTIPTIHKAGTPVKHLMQEFGLFVPDGDSDLYLEIARRTAEIYNACGFDMIYLDAIDGTSCVKKTDRSDPENDLSWYYANRFVSELMRCVKKVPILEMSAMWHHFWFYRSRMGAWDYSARSHKMLLSAHDASNRRSRLSTFMPQNYGWWAYGKINPKDSVQTQRIYLDDYEFFASRACKSGWSLAFILTLEEFHSSAELQRAACLIRQYEKLRLEGRSDVIPESTECLIKSSGQIVPVTYYHTDSTAESALKFLAEKNERILQLRIENLPLAVQNDSLCLLSSFDCRDLRTYCSTTVTASSEERTDSGAARKGLQLHASQSGELGYARFEKKYAVPLNAESPRAIGFWVYGDGKCEKLDIQLISPKHRNSGTADFVITVDFKGWKHFLFYHPNPELLSEDSWPFSGGGHYNDPPYHPEFDIAKETPCSQTTWHPSRRDVGIYMLTREKIYWDCIESISVLIGGMKDGETYDLILGDVYAYKLEAHSLSDPIVYYNSDTIQIKGKLDPFTYVEWRDGMCSAFDSNGHPCDEITIGTPPASLNQGENTFRVFSEDTRITLSVGIGK